MVPENEGATTGSTEASAEQQDAEYEAQEQAAGNVDSDDLDRAAAEMTAAMRAEPNPLARIDTRSASERLQDQLQEYARKQARENPYFNREADPVIHERAVEEVSVGIRMRAEQDIWEQDPSDPYRGIGPGDAGRHAVVGAARADGLAPEVLTRLFAAWEQAGVNSENDVRRVWGLSFDEKLARADKWIAARPAMRQLLYRLNEANRARAAVAVEAMVAYEESVDAEIAELMKPGSAYWTAHDPQHGRAVEKVSQLMKRRHG